MGVKFGGRFRPTKSHSVDAGCSRSAPYDWRIVTVGELGTCSSGTTPSRKRTQDYYVNGTTNWVKTLDLNNAVIRYTDERVTDQAISDTSLTVYPAGTVLVAMYGGFNQIGRTGLLSIPAAVNQAITAIQLQRQLLLPEYLLYTLNHSVDHWKSVASSSRKDPNITGADVRAFPLACPPISEQHAIAEALSSADDLIRSLDALIAKKRAIKEGAMQQLLTGKARLPGFSGEWVTKSLGEIGDVSGAGVDKKIRSDEEPVRLVNYMDVYRRTFLYSKHLDQVVSARPEHAERCAVQKGDVFFTPTSEVPNDIGRSAVAMEDIANGVYSYHVVRLRLRASWDLRFRGYAFKTKAFLDEASRVCEGSGTRYVITLPRFRSLPVRFPQDPHEQESIAAVLSDMDAEIEALEQRRDKAKAIKEGMMQQLLTGRIRLVKPEESGEPVEAGAAAGGSA